MEKVNPILEGNGVRLRLATMNDVRFLFDLRTDPELTNYLPPLTDYNSHCIWLERNLPADDNYLFVAEAVAAGDLHGIISIYNIDFSIMHAEIGRWVMKPGSKFSFEVCYLAYKFAFETLGLQKTHVDLFEANKAGIAFNKKIGYTIDNENEKNYVINGASHKSVLMCLSRAEWPSTAIKLKKFSSMMLGEG